VQWSFQQVRAWRKSALATVQSFPLGLRSYADTLADCEIRHMQGYCGGEPNVVTAHICVAAYLNSLRSISTRNRASLKIMAAAEARFYSRYQGRVIAISQKIAQELREFYQVPGVISIIHHGVDSTRFDKTERKRNRSAVRTELDINEDETVALYVGDLTKAHVHLKRLAKAAPQVQLIIVSGSRRYHWSARNVRFLPVTTALQRFYAAADAFAFPTTYDAFGMVVLEAMASGLPVFSSNCAGAAELLNSGKDGFVNPLDEWVDATVAGLHDRETLLSVGREAEKTARQHDWSNVVRKVEQVYLQTVADAGFLRSERRPVAYSHERYQR
jgi:UDP-glucose:(heptosyl)LPS alpha-1,3-glucosyltransferase